MTTHGALPAMHEPAAAILSRHGVRFRTKHAGGVTWYNMEECPVCGHSGYQCGVAESVGADGKLRHAVKCWHVADNGLGTDTPDYEDFLLKIGEVTPNPYSLIAETSMGIGIKGRRGVKKHNDVRLLNAEFLAVLKKRLRGVEFTAGGTEPTAFCQGCEGCIYSLHNCEIMPKRLRIEGRDNPVR